MYATPAPQEVIQWEAKILSNVRELEAQSALIRDWIQRHKSSSPTSIIAAIDQLKKGAKVMLYLAALLKDRVASLERANKAAIMRKQRKKKRI